MVASIQSSTPIISPIYLTTTIFQCSICKKILKSKRGLAQHEAIIRKYNHNNFYKLPVKFINEFKKTLVLLIHRQLPNHFNKMGMKVVTIACTEGQFLATFNGYIHNYSSKTQAYKCIFWGPNAKSKLAQIFNNENWGIKFYHGGETTLVVTNLLELDTEENPLSQKQKLINSQRKS